jgi:DNA-binding NarL/FixJ family response regulator
VSVDLVTPPIEPSDARPFTAVLLQAGQLINLARYPQAERALETAGRVAERDDDVVAAAFGRASIRFWHLADLDGAHRVLDEAAARLGGRAAAEDLLAQRAALWLFSGRTARALVACRAVRRRGHASVAGRQMCAALEAAALGLRGDAGPLEPVTDLVPEDDLLAFGVGARALAVAFARAVNGLDTDPAAPGTAEPVASRRRAAVAASWDGANDLIDATNLLWAGRARAAAVHAERSVACFRRNDRIHLLAAACGQLAYARALVGDAAGATAAAADAVAARHPVARLVEFWIGRGQAWAAAARGELSAARELLVMTAETCGRLGQPALAAQAWYDAARLDGAATAVAPLQRLATGAARRAPAERALAPLLAQHVAAVADGDAAGVAAAAVRARGRGHLLHAAEAAAQAATLLARQRRADAEQWAVTARVLAGACDGARTPALAWLLCVDLTAREREIVGLAARGLTNPDIARRLHLSVRTVGNHLQAAYAKLGVHRREELARFHPFG